MTCYRDCIEGCDDIKIMYCLRRLSKKQYEFKRAIRDSRICDCGEVMPVVKYREKKRRICFSCKRGLLVGEL